MDQNAEQQPQSEVDRIVAQIQKNRGQQDAPEKDPRLELKRNIATNLDFVGMAALWATRPKMGKTGLAHELVEKGFEKMRGFYESDLFLVNEVLDEMIEKERVAKEQKGIEPAMTPLIQNHRDILKEEKKSKE